MTQIPPIGSDAAALPTDQKSSPSADAPAWKAKKQAIVVVHGMGEQRPMDTIKGFVESVWCADNIRTRKEPDAGAIWIKPDERTGSLELRRITTRSSIPSVVAGTGYRSDFYELYWADLSAGNPWEAFTGWLQGLLVRPILDVPLAARNAWLLLWALVIVLSIAALLAVLPEGKIGGFDVWAHVPIPRWVYVVIVGVATAALHATIEKTFGRVVRYTMATPANIAARRAIRERGLALLEGLHESGDRYDRIVVVGHSLGSILAYELVAFFWARHDAGRTVETGSTAFDLLFTLEEAGRQLESKPEGRAERDAWFAAQRALRLNLSARAAPDPKAQSAVDRRWLISDFVTLGCPLAYADALLAATKADLTARMTRREMPTAPPLREPLSARTLAAAQAAKKLGGATDAALFSFPPAPGAWQMHFAAPFAVVRWTNIYDTSRWVVFGDQISGPLRPLFGPAVIDIDLAAIRGPARCFTHTQYWSLAADPRVLECLRAAINIPDDDGTDPEKDVRPPAQTPLEAMIARKIAARRMGDGIKS